MTEQNIENKGGLPVSFQRIAVIIRKWRWTAFSVALVIVALMTAYTLLRAPVYTAVGRVWIENDPNILPFDDVLRYDAGSYLESHSKLFRSRSLAAETIEKLKLYEDPRFVGEPGKRKKPVDIKDPFFREALVGAFIGRITVTPLLRTRIVEVAFEDRDPKFASDTLNALFDGYLEMTARQKYLSLEDASKFLNSQIEAVRNELTESEKKLNAYGSEQDILPLTAAETPMVTRVADISRELMQASVERVKKNSEYLQIKSGTLESIPSSRDNPLVQSLREQYSTLSQEYAKKLANVRPEYPEMQRMKSQMDSINAALQKERENMIGAAFSDYQAALSKEQSLQRLLDQEKTQAFSAQSSSIIYNSLKAEIENKRVLLNELITRQSETDMSSRLKSMKPTNVWIVDRASLPLQPTSPKKRRDLLLGLVFGVLGGCGAAFLIEYLNHSVKTSRDVMTQTGLPTLGLIPSFDGETRAKSPRAEFARSPRHDPAQGWAEGLRERQGPCESPGFAPAHDGTPAGIGGRAGGGDRTDRLPQPRIYPIRELPVDQDDHAHLRAARKDQIRPVHKRPGAGREVLHRFQSRRHPGPGQQEGDHRRCRSSAAQTT